VKQRKKKKASLKFESRCITKTKIHWTKKRSAAEAVMRRRKEGASISETQVGVATREKPNFSAKRRQDRGVT